MMDLIDRDELELDTEWSDYYDGYMSYSQSQINGAPTVKAIPLEKVKQAKEKLEIARGLKQLIMLMYLWAKKKSILFGWM
jgi:hypothetical protein